MKILMKNMHVLIHELIDLGLYKVIKVLVPKYIPSIMKKGDGGKGVLSVFLFTWI